MVLQLKCQSKKKKKKGVGNYINLIGNLDVLPHRDRGRRSITLS